MVSRACLVLVAWALAWASWAAPVARAAPPSPTKEAPKGLVQPVKAQDVLDLLRQLVGAPPVGQEALLFTLRDLGPGAAPALAEALNDPSLGWTERGGAAWVLGELAEPSSRPSLDLALRAPQAPGPFRAQVAFAIGALGDTKPLRALLSDPDKVLVAKAATGLANLRDKDAAPLLRPLAQDPDIGPFVLLALGRLGEMPQPDALQALLKEPQTRDHAAVALGMGNDRSALLPVRYALRCPDPFVRRDAVEILGRWEDVASLNELKALLARETDKRVLAVGELALRRLERKAKRR